MFLSLVAFLALLPLAALAQVGQIPIAVQPSPSPSAFYVATNGSDANPGTLGSPFLTFARCQTAMRGSGARTCTVRGGVYPMTAGLVLGPQDANETWTYYAPDTGTLPTVGAALSGEPQLTQNSAFVFFTLTAGANNVTITGFNATGFQHVLTASCGGSMFADSTGTSNLVVSHNTFSNMDCGYFGNGDTNPVAAANFGSIIEYVGIGCSACSGAPGQSVWSGNLLYDIDPDEQGPNGYGIVFTYSGVTASANFTGQGNAVYNSPNWECYDNHAGTNIFWINNICVGAGRNTAINSVAHSSSVPLITPKATNNILDLGSPLKVVYGCLTTYTYNLVTNFGAVSGGSTATNNAAFEAYNTEAQRRTRPAVTGWYAGGANGAGNAYAGASPNNCIVLNIPAGTYQYTDNSWMLNISNEQIVGAGGLVQSTNLQNLNNSASEALNRPVNFNYDYVSTFIVGAANNLGYFIKTAPIGSISVTLSGSPANASKYFVGGWVLIASYDQQFGGYPPNFRYYDYAIVTSANTSTGVIGLDRPTTFYHIGLPSGFTGSSPTRPYTGTLTDGPSGTIGPARIIPIDTPAHPICRYCEVDGIHFLTNPNAGLRVSDDCPQASGVLDGAENDILEDGGMCFAMLRNFSVNNSQWQADEADKIINTLTFNNDRIVQFDASHAGELNFNVNGGHISNTNTAADGGNIFQGLNGSWQNVTLDAMLNSCSVFSAAVGSLQQFQTLSLSFNNVTFIGDNCTNNAPINAPEIITLTMDGSTNVIQTGPNGANTRLRFPASQVCDGCVASNWGDGAAINKNGTWVAGAKISTGGVTFDGTFLYVDVQGTTFTTGDLVYAALWNLVSVTNSVCQTTGFPCANSGGGIRYPNGQTLPAIVWSGNSGN